MREATGHNGLGPRQARRARSRRAPAPRARHPVPSPPSTPIPALTDPETSALYQEQPVHTLYLDLIRNVAVN